MSRLLGCPHFRAGFALFKLKAYIVSIPTTGVSTFQEVGLEESIII